MGKIKFKACKVCGCQPALYRVPYKAMSVFYYKCIGCKVIYGTGTGYFDDVAIEHAADTWNKKN